MTEKERVTAEAIRAKTYHPDKELVDECLLTEIIGILQVFRATALANNSMGNRDTAQMILTKAIPIIRKAERERIYKLGIDIAYQPDRLDRPVVTTPMNFEAINMLFKNKLKITKKVEGRLIFVQALKEEK